MTHEIRWLKPERVLYVSYKDHQTPATLKACLDDMAAYLDTVKSPVALIINWQEVTDADPGVLKSNVGHRTYRHPMAGQGLLVGFDRQERFENETTSVKSRRGKNTRYFDTIDEALRYLEQTQPEGS